MCKWVLKNEMHLFKYPNLNGYHSSTIGRIRQQMLFCFVERHQIGSSFLGMMPVIYKLTMPSKN